MKGRSFHAALCFAAIAMAACLNPINGSLIVTAYPELAASLHVPYAHVSALVMYFLAATAAMQPMAGAIGDYMGSKRAYLVGIIGFSAASLVAGYASTFTSLVVWRTVQALFSALITANASPLLYRVIPQMKIGTYLGLLSSAMVGATALAFPLGGLLTKYAGWPILFWCCLPVALLSLILVWIFIPADDQRKGTTFSILSFLGVPVVPLAVGLQSYIHAGSVLAPLALVLCSSLALVFALRKSPAATAVLKSIASRDFIVACAIACFAAAIPYALMFMLPAWLPVALGVSSAELGLYIGIFTLSMMIWSPIAGRLADRHGYLLPKLALVGTSGIAFILMMYGLSIESFILSMLLIGIGIAFAQVISQRSSLLAAPAAARALSMGLFSSARSIGCIMGNAVPAALMVSSASIAATLGPQLIALIGLLFLLPMAGCLYFLRSHATA